MTIVIRLVLTFVGTLQVYVRWKRRPQSARRLQFRTLQPSRIYYNSKIQFLNRFNDTFHSEIA